MTKANSFTASQGRGDGSVVEPAVRRVLVPWVQALSWKDYADSAFAHFEQLKQKLDRTDPSYRE